MVASVPFVREVTTAGKVGTCRRIRLASVAVPAVDTLTVAVADVGENTKETSVAIITTAIKNRATMLMTCSPVRLRLFGKGICISN